MFNLLVSNWSINHHIYLFSEKIPNEHVLLRITIYFKNSVFFLSVSLGLNFCDMLKCAQGGCDCSVRVCNWRCRAANTRLSRLTYTVECTVHMGLLQPRPGNTQETEFWISPPWVLKDHHPYRGRQICAGKHDPWRLPLSMAHRWRG